MLVRDWGYDKYQGDAILSRNAGVCFMAMAYGKGRFDGTVEIATMAGWDTDCNAGNVGTVLGVACGLKGLPERYRKPVNDGIVCSGISGYLNILDIPTFSKELALLGYRLSGEERLPAWRKALRTEIHFDFELPGSTHNMRVSDPFFCALSHSGDQAFSGSGSLKILGGTAWCAVTSAKVFYKPFYTRNDFSDERYSPVFTDCISRADRIDEALSGSVGGLGRRWGLRHTYIPFTGKRISFRAISSWFRNSGSAWNSQSRM